MNEEVNRLKLQLEHKEREIQYLKQQVTFWSDQVKGLEKEVGALKGNRTFEPVDI